MHYFHRRHGWLLIRAFWNIQVQGLVATPSQICDQWAMKLVHYNFSTRSSIAAALTHIRPVIKCVSILLMLEVLGWNSVHNIEILLCIHHT